MSLIKRTSSFYRRGFLFPILLIFLSCATVSTVNPVSEGAFAAELPAISFPAIETIVPVWHEVEEGIGYLNGRILRPQLEFWAIKIDLDSPDIRIVVSGGEAGESGTLSTKVSSFVRDNNLIAGLNATPFDVSTAVEGQPIRNMGIIVSDGRQIARANQQYDALVFFKPESPEQNGNAAIMRQSEIGSVTEEIENAIGGFHKILAGGEVAQRTEGREDRHPRSAAGVSANGRILYLLVIDGRRAGSAGATEKETALLLQALGSYDGINFDGGGSSALALRYPDGTVQTVNTPVHGGIPSRERAVAGSIGVTR